MQSTSCRTLGSHDQGSGFTLGVGTASNNYCRLAVFRGSLSVFVISRCFHALGQACDLHGRVFVMHDRFCRTGCVRML